jgi:hypothetical protein
MDVLHGLYPNIRRLDVNTILALFFYFFSSPVGGGAARLAEKSMATQPGLKKRIIRPFFSHCLDAG